jgi:hypothetical protein
MELLSQGLTSTLAGSTQQDEHSMDDSSTYGVANSQQELLPNRGE